ncbi:MAG: TetR/AcrR family transcriptional regulator [Gilvibacter sp.]
MSKKEQLFDTVLRLTATQGLWDTPMSQIAKFANMAVGTIYNHFATKEQLLSELYIHTQVQIAHALTPLNEAASYQAQFEQLFDNGYSFLVSNPFIYKYSMQVGHAPLLTKPDKQKAKSFFKPFELFFENGINQGAIQPGNAALLAQFSYTQILALAQTQIEGTLYVTDIMKKQIVDRSWNAIKATS